MKTPPSRSSAAAEPSEDASPPRATAPPAAPRAVQRPNTSLVAVAHSRRGFLRAGSVALSGLALAPRFAFAADNPDKKIRLGVVGGNFGRSFYWHEHPNCTVAAVSDLRPERRSALMKTYNCGQRTWRYGFPPMHYPTHCTAHLVSVTGERLTQVSCIGWGDDDPVLKENVYRNPFWDETAFFKTSGGNIFRVAVYWKGAFRGTERAQWYGEKMSFFSAHPNGLGSVIVRAGKQTETDSGGFPRQLPDFEKYDQPQWWRTELLPEPLRHDSGHEGSHTFLTYEFIDALVHGRRPAVDVHEAVAYVAPGIVAHQSALRGGEQMKIPAFDPVRG